MKKSWLPEYVKYLFSVYITGIVFFTVFRILLFLANLHKLDTLPAGKFFLILRAFLMGFRFDTVISGYILILPLLTFSLAAVFFPGKKWVSRIHTLYTGVLYSTAFLICAVDIPYYGFFNSRLSAIVCNWFDTPGFLVRMSSRDIGNWFYVSAFVLFCFFFWYIILKFEKKFFPLPAFPPAASGMTYGLKIFALFIVSFLLLFIGIRGRLAKKSPIRVGTAYFSNYSFPNQLGLNPVFTFIGSAIERIKQQKHERDFMDSEQAVARVRRYLNIDPQKNCRYDSPIARLVETKGAPLRANVVLIIMESMSAEKMGCYGNPLNLTPNLDRLAQQSLSFDNIYTSGVHTANGIYSSLFSFTAIFKQHPLKPATILTYSGLPNTLKDNGYSTIFFVTHDDQFDNLGGFLRANGFEQIVSQKDYPADRVLSTLGVPDDYMFEIAIPRLNKLAERDRPFLAVFMTCSDHPPYIIPKNIPFKPRSGPKSEQSVEYVDWAIAKFINSAAQQKWFKNTLFVFIADHGANLNPIYDMPLSYFHTPLIIYSPSLIKVPRRVAKIGGQIDLFPTIMGLLNISYVNNTPGIDLLKEERPFIYFCGDDKLGCLNDEYFLVIRDSGYDSLYAYRKRDQENVLVLNKKLAEAMKDYFFSMMQTTQWLIRNDKVGSQQPLSPAPPQQPGRPDRRFR